MNRPGAVVVFAKVPRPGWVKTRMSPPFSADEAAELYGCMLEDVLEATAAAAARLGLQPILAAHPPSALAELVGRVPPAYRIVAQRGRDLSERMTRQVAEAAAGGASPVLIRGSDSPALGADVFRRVLEELETSDLVIAPDVDGGYNLVGLTRPVSGLFDHPMSTSSVLDDTVACARELGLRTRVLDETFDLDSVDDLALLAAARERGDTDACPRTLAYLDARGAWPRPS